jgi:hypothetical protein
MGKARRDGDQLVGQRRETLADDHPGAVLGVPLLERDQVVAHLIDPNQPLAQTVEQEGADGIAHRAAQHRPQRAPGRQGPGALAVCQHHRDQHDIGGDGEEGRFRRRQRAQRAPGMLALGVAHHPVIQRADNAVLFSRRIGTGGHETLPEAELS